MGRDFPPKGGSREGKGEKGEKEDGKQGLGSIARLARGSEERSSEDKERSLDPPIRASSDPQGREERLLVKYKRQTDKTGHFRMKSYVAASMIQPS